MKLHILGICGTFMGGVAALARELGHEVDGSDQSVYPPMSTQLEQLGIALSQGYTKDSVSPDTDMVVVGNELLVERLAGRAKLEGRADDTPESVRNRLSVYNEQTAPVVDFYRQQGKLSCVHGVGSMDEVFNRIVEAMNPTSDVG